MLNLNYISDNPLVKTLVVAGAFTAPLVAMTLISSSKIILIDIIATIAIGILSGGTISMFGFAETMGVGLIALPTILWKISIVLAAVGAAIAIIVGLVFLTGLIYEKCMKCRETV